MQTTGQQVYTYDAHEGGALKKHPVDVFSERASLSQWLLSMPHLTNMVWDNKDQLISAGNGTVTSYYNYDVQGDRSRKIVVKPGGIVEERYYVSGYEVYRKFISSSLDTERETVHIMDDRDRFVIIDTLTVENGVSLTTPVVTIRYQYSNHLGSACLELDSAAATISYEEYHPFGTTSYRSGRNEVDVSLKRYKYVGKERDEETGLYYYGARYYAAWLCRFVSVDPLNEKYPELSAYQYASNRPITMIDLDGLEGMKPSQVKNAAKEKASERSQKESKTIYSYDEGTSLQGPVKPNKEFKKPNSVDYSEIVTVPESPTQPDFIQIQGKYSGSSEYPDPEGINPPNQPLDFVNTLKTISYVASLLPYSSDIVTLYNSSYNRESLGSAPNPGGLIPLPGELALLNIPLQIQLNEYFGKLDQSLITAQSQKLDKCKNYAELAREIDNYNKQFNDLDRNMIIIIYTENAYTRGNTIYGDLKSTLNPRISAISSSFLESGLLLNGFVPNYCVYGYLGDYNGYTFKVAGCMKVK